jgi:glycosyltransferase involved in cell wall biosynthesis
VIALDGPRGWSELTESGALAVAPPDAGALADAIAGLLADGQAREALGARGREFAERRMGVARTVQAVMGLLGEAGPQSAA